MKITAVSALSGKPHTQDIDVTQEQFMAWRNGALIQDAMPNLSASEREFLMTGITDEEWEEHFADDEEEDV